MRESRFVKENRQKWIRFEQVLNDPKRDPEETSQLFTEITDDLSYARTFYPNRIVRVYLNGIAQKVYQNIYKNRAGKARSFWSFWRDELPLLLWEERKMLGLALLLFCLGIALGSFSTIANPGFLSSLFSEEHIRVIYQSINTGSPASVYQSTDADLSFIGYVFNNVKTIAITFVSGLLLGIGSIYSLLLNGMKIGSFQTIFFVEGSYTQSFLVIWTHALLEFTALILSGAGGLALGRGLLFPETFSRLQSLQIAARRGGLIFMSALPFVLLAAFIEAYITSSFSVSYAMRFLIIFLSASFVFWYALWRPYTLGRKNSSSALSEVDLPQSPKQEIVYNSIKGASQIFSESYSFYWRKIPFFASTAFVLASLTSSVFLFFGDFFYKPVQGYTFIDEIAEGFVQMSPLFFPEEDYSFLLQIFSWTLLIGLSLLLLGREAHKEHADKKLGVFYYLRALGLSFSVAFLLVSSFRDMDIAFWVFVLFAPVFLFVLAALVHSSKNIFSASIEAFQLLFRNISKLAGSYFSVLLSCFLLCFITTAPLVNFYFKVIIELIPIDNVQIKLFHQGFYIFVNAFVLYLILPLPFLAQSLAYFSFRETIYAYNLRSKIKQIEPQKKVYGMVQENRTKEA